MFFRALHSDIQFSLHSTSALFGAQQQLTHPPVKILYPLVLGRIMFLRAYCFVNVVTLSCLRSLWFGTHTILLVKSICAFIVPMVSFYSKRLPLPNTLFCDWSVSIVKDRCYQNILLYVRSISLAKDCCFAEECNPRLWWSFVDFGIFFLDKTLESNIMVYFKKVSD